MFVEEAIEANEFDIQLSLRFLKSVSINLIERLFLYHASSVVGYALHARDIVFYTTDLHVQTVVFIGQFTPKTDAFPKKKQLFI